MHYQKLLRQWEGEWKGSKWYRRMAAIDDAISHRPYRKLTSELHRVHSSLLFALRTGYVALHAYLHRIQVEDSPTCPHCSQRETVHHFLLQCPKFTRHRQRLRTNVGFENMTLHSLLTNRKLLQPLIRYIKSTRRLAQVFPHIPPVPDPVDEK